MPCRAVAVPWRRLEFGSDANAIDNFFACMHCVAVIFFYGFQSSYSLFVVSILRLSNWSQLSLASFWCDTIFTHPLPNYTTRRNPSRFILRRSLARSENGSALPSALQITTHSDCTPQLLPNEAHTIFYLISVFSERFTDTECPEGFGNGSD